MIDLESFNFISRNKVKDRTDRDCVAWVTRPVIWRNGDDIYFVPEHMEDHQFMFIEKDYLDIQAGICYKINNSKLEEIIDIKEI